MNLPRRQHRSDRKPEVIPTFTVPCPICAALVTVTIEVRATTVWVSSGWDQDNPSEGFNVAIVPRYSHSCTKARAA